MTTFSEIWENGGAKWFWGSFCGFGILLTCILVPLSIFDVSHDDYAIKYDSLTKKVDHSIVEEGKYIFTPETELFYYNKIVVTISFTDFICLTNDGINIEMNLNIQYQLIKNELFSIFWEFGKEEQLKTLLKNIAEDSIRDVCSIYEHGDFPDQRDIIQSNMENTLANDFILSKAHAELQYLELINYEFPDSLNTAIDSKQSALQDINNAENEREGELTIAGTLYNTVSTEAETLVNQAEGTAEAILTAAEEEATSTTEIWENRLKTYYKLKEEMEMTSEEFVSEYLYGVIIVNSKNVYTNIN